MMESKRTDNTFTDIPIVIDGPNFINAFLIDPGDQEIVSQNFSFPRFRHIINQELQKFNLCGDQIEFVCSRRMFGSKETKFTRNQRNLMINRFKKEIGVHVEEVTIPGKKEKGVDITVAEKINVLSQYNRFIVFVSADRDYIPILKRKREEGIRVFTVALFEDFPIEIRNESHMTIDIRSEQRDYVSGKNNNDPTDWDPHNIPR